MTSTHPVPPLPQPQPPAAAAQALADAAGAAARAWARPLHPDRHQRAVSQLYSHLARPRHRRPRPGRLAGSGARRESRARGVHPARDLRLPLVPRRVHGLDERAGVRGARPAARPRRARRRLVPRRPQRHPGLAAARGQQRHRDATVRRLSSRRAGSCPPGRSAWPPTRPAAPSSASRPYRQPRRGRRGPVRRRPGSPHRHRPGAAPRGTADRASREPLDDPARQGYRERERDCQRPRQRGAGSRGPGSRRRPRQGRNPPRRRPPDRQPARPRPGPRAHGPDGVRAAAPRRPVPRAQLRRHARRRGRAVQATEHRLHPARERRPGAASPTRRSGSARATSPPRGSTAAASGRRTPGTTSTATPASTGSAWRKSAGVLTTRLLAGLRHYADHQGSDFQQALAAGLAAHARQRLSAEGPFGPGKTPPRTCPAAHGTVPAVRHEPGSRRSRRLTRSGSWSARRPAT